jgi:hypothetical protein
MYFERRKGHYKKCFSIFYRYNINYEVFEYQQKSSFLQLSTRQPLVKAIIIGNLSCEQQISKYSVKIIIITCVCFFALQKKKWRVCLSVTPGSLEKNLKFWSNISPPLYSWRVSQARNQQEAGGIQSQKCSSEKA